MQSGDGVISKAEFMDPDTGLLRRASLPCRARGLLFHLCCMRCWSICCAHCWSARDCRVTQESLSRPRSFINNTFSDAGGRGRSVPDIRSDKHAWFDFWDSDRSGTLEQASGFTSPARERCSSGPTSLPRPLPFRKGRGRDVCPICTEWGRDVRPVCTGRGHRVPVVDVDLAGRRRSSAR